MNLGIASDHAGFELKQKLKIYLENKGHRLTDFGANSAESSDYADFAHPLAEAVGEDKFDLGITICGSGNGINMTSNKHQNIRSAICWKKDIAELARSHNDANMCSLPARFISEEEAYGIIDTFLSTEFEGGRHERRIKKIPINQ